MLELIKRAGTFANRIAIISGGKQFTYRQLLDDSAAAAGALLGGAADLDEARVAFLVPPSYDYVRCQWGIWRAGGVAVPLCTAHPLPALRYVLEDTRADTLILHPDYGELLGQRLRSWAFEC
jgi:malonyl-CoA/methylmalonyl-CoA synthetase